MDEGGDRARTGVLLLTFGSAVTAADVPVYLHSVRGGRDPSPEVVREFQRRFELIGRSPLIDITRAQATALAGALAARHGDGRFLVAAGMLHSAPRVGDALASLVDAGASEVLAVVLAPQYSPLVLGGYERALAACAPLVAPGVEVRIAGAWGALPSWIDTITAAVDEALDSLDPAAREAAGVVFTAHSLPRAVVERDPAYMAQIDETVAAVAQAVGLPRRRWAFAYQSAGHTPEEWLTPDLTEVLARMRGEGFEDVLVVPVQFVADHLEVLYDIDIAAADQAREAGIRFHRITMPNTSPRFITALADVVERELAGPPVPSAR